MTPAQQRMSETFGSRKQGVWARANAYVDRKGTHRVEVSFATTRGTDTDAYRHAHRTLTDAFAAIRTVVQDRNGGRRGHNAVGSRKRGTWARVNSYVDRKGTHRVEVSFATTRGTDTDAYRHALESIRKAFGAIAGIKPPHAQDQPKSHPQVGSVTSVTERTTTNRPDRVRSVSLDATDAKAGANVLKQAVDHSIDDVGIIDERALRAKLAGSRWDQHLPELINRAGLERVSGYLVRRPTARARVKAALLKIGSAATKSELAERSGLTESQVAGALSSIASVARSDKNRWGLREWIDDVYEGIPAEIMQRIAEDGGSTRLNRLLEELPRLFGVSESSVRVYLSTPAFCVEHGWVRPADEPHFSIGRFADVATGQDNNGDPYWQFLVESQHLRGFSIVGIPPELASTLGCSFGSKTTARVRSPAGSRDVAVNWRKTSVTGPEIGRIANALRMIGAREGDRVCLVVHIGPEVSFVSWDQMKTDRASTGGDDSIWPLSRSAPSSLGGPLSIDRAQTGVRVARPISGRLSRDTGPVGGTSTTESYSLPSARHFADEHNRD